MSITTNQVRWLAGILEGEGTFSLVGRNGEPVIKLKMTDLDVIEHVRAIVDPHKAYAVTLSQEDNRKPAYTITLNGTRAIQWMMTIYPLMGLRRKTRIRELLFVWKLKKSKPMGSPHGQDVKMIMTSRKVSRPEAERILLEILLEK